MNNRVLRYEAQIHLMKGIDGDQEINEAAPKCTQKCRRLKLLKS